MNATQLLTHFDRLAEAPDAVPRLRRFILDLAVRGKLVEQDAADESAATLLKRLDIEKSRLVDLGEVRQERARVPIDPEEMTFKLPLGWEWTRFGDYASDIATGPFGSALHQSDYVFNGIPLVNPSHMQNGRIVPDPKVTVSEETAKSLAVYRMRAGDIVMARRGEVGRAATVTQRESGWLCGTGSFYLRFALDVNRDYVILLLLCDSVRRYLAGEAVGTTMVNLNHSILKRMPLAIPPLAEQHRIVAKVDELMALCDQLEAAQQERERRRDRLAAASLQRLNQPADANPATDQTEPAEARQQAQRDQQKDHARFHLQNLNRLTTRPEHIKAMRQTILNLAVRGFLSENRDWASQPQQLRTVATLQNGYAFKSEWFAKSGIRLLRNTNVSHGVIRWDDLACLSELQSAEYERFRLLEGDIVLSLDRPFIATGTKVARVRAKDLPCLLLQRVGRFQLNSRLIATDYLFLLIESPQFTDQIDPGRSNGVPHISSKQVESAEIFLPPLAEQHRIVAKVDELMALCDQLEAQLTQSQTDSRRLLEAVLSTALEPVA